MMPFFCEIRTMPVCFPPLLPMKHKNTESVWSRLVARSLVVEVVLVDKF